MILFLFLSLELLLGPDHDLKSYSGILHFQTTKSHNFQIIRNPCYFFFLFSSVQGPTTQIGPLAYDTGGTFFQLCCCISFWFWWEIGFRFTYLYTQSTIQLHCCVRIFVLAGNSFWCYVSTQCTIQLCRCVRFLVVVGKGLKIRILSTKKILLGYFIMICQPMWYFNRHNTFLLCTILFCIFLLYRADPQVGVQIRILLKDKYRKLSRNANTGNHTLIS